MDMSVRIGLTQFSAHSDDFTTDQLTLTYKSPDVSLHTPEQTPCTLSNAQANGVYYSGTLNCPALVVDGSTAACSATGFIYFEVCDAH